MDTRSQSSTNTHAGDVNDRTMREWEDRLVDHRASDRFSVDELDGLPEPVRRYLSAAIAVGTPLATTARLRMRGRIKVGRWLPYRARQVLNPHVGFIWTARAAGVITGYDRYLDGAGEMNWRIFGRFNVAHGDGPDVSRSAAGRAAAEAIWIPTALLPRYGVTWTCHGDHHITAHHGLGGAPVAIQLTIDSTGAVQSVAFERWGDPDKSGVWRWHSFGGQITGHRTFAGLRVPSAGRLGWHVGTDRWPDGEFFRYEITSLGRPGVHDGAAS